MKDTPLPVTVTLTDVTAVNIRRLREGDPDEYGHKHRVSYSRRALAELLTATTGEQWSDWRIVDLEGGRTGMTSPERSKTRDRISAT